MFVSKIRILSIAGALVFGISHAAPTSKGAAAPIIVREYVPDDATDTDKVFEWMSDEGIDEENLVFYTQPEGEAWAKAFVEANDGYNYYGTLFGGKFIEDFGGPNIQNEDIAECLSLTMAEYASGIARVFNNEPEGGNGYYWGLELEELQKSKELGWIYDIHDGTTDPEDYGDILKGLDEDSDSDSDDEDAEGEDDDGILDHIF